MACARHAAPDSKARMKKKDCKGCRIRSAKIISYDELIGKSNIERQELKRLIDRLSEKFVTIASCLGPFPIPETVPVGPDAEMAEALQQAHDALALLGIEEPYKKVDDGSR